MKLKLCGRAGNQLFQYAAVSTYMKNNGITDILQIYYSKQINNEKKSKSVLFVDDLKKFNVKEYETIDDLNMTLKQKLIDFLYRAYVKIIKTIKIKINKTMTYNDYKVMERIWHKVLNRNGLYYYMPTNLNFYKSKNKNIIFWGSFEDLKLFDNNKEDILKMYSPLENKLEKNKDLYTIIKNTNSVCITIRRGDFLEKENKRNFFICDSNYFYSAIKKMNSLIKNPQYIVFSDDINWCKENMKFPPNTLYESGDDPIWEKIRLMYSCKNFIISNSTFSWWAQYLSTNEDKKVIAPSKWNNFEYSDPIYDKKWILI